MALLASVCRCATPCSLALSLTTPAAAQSAQSALSAPQVLTSTDREILHREEKAHVVAAEAQIAIVAQTGESGYQSQAGSYYGPGSEQALIIQPSGLVTIEQSPGIEHEFSATVDIVSAASVNALDATSTASAVNEAIDLGARSRIRLGENYTFRSGIGVHFEEPLRSARYQLGIDRALGQGSAAVGLSLGAVLDTFDNHLPNGKSKTGDMKRRSSYNANLSFSQILSPTTLLLLGYGFTHQRGTLRTPWNSVPLEGGLEGPMLRGGERLPDARNRHAATIELAQLVPQTHSTFRVDYRYYTDTFSIRAHNAQLVYFQYLGPSFLVKTHYRFYLQTAAYFYGTSFPQTVEVQEGEVFRTRPWLFEPAILQTADSDLAAFLANEVGTELSFIQLSGHSLDIGYTYYRRTNGLAAHILSLGYAAYY